MKNQPSENLPKKVTKGRRKKLFSLRRFQCQMGCYKRFASYAAREYHQDAVHKEVVHVCQWILCTKVFKCTYHYERHLKKGHDMVNFLTGPVGKVDGFLTI